MFNLGAVFKPLFFYYLLGLNVLHKLEIGAKFGSVVRIYHPYKNPHRRNYLRQQGSLTSI